MSILSIFEQLFIIFKLGPQPFTQAAKICPIYKFMTCKNPEKICATANCDGYDYINFLTHAAHFSQHILQSAEMALSKGPHTLVRAGQDIFHFLAYVLLLHGAGM